MSMETRNENGVLEEKAPESKHFIEREIEKDLAEGVYDHVHTRFPPEPNGYLHIGHAKSIILNSGMAQEYHGQFNLRFDDTNPMKEKTEFVEAIERDVKWLGADFEDRIFFASDYFDIMYEKAILLIKKGLAFVDDLTAEQITAYRGDFTNPGKESPNRNRPIEENLQLFQDMKDGKYADGTLTLRAKIDYGFCTAATTMGSIGIKVWIYHGEKLPGGKTPQPALEGNSRPSRGRRDRNDRNERGAK